MKKILVFLAFIIAVGFTACDDKNDKQEPDPENPAEYTITFDANEGTGGPTTAKAIFGQPMPALTAQAPTREGHSFNGYFDAKTGGVRYYDANLASVKNWDKKAAAILSAQWTPLPPGTTAITFNQNEGTGGPATATATFGQPMPVLSAQAPTREGYTFNGYFDEQTGGNKYYNADLTSAKNWDKEAASAVLFAQWTLIPPPAGSFVITFNNSGGTGGPTTVVAEYGKAMPALTAQAPTKAGDYFSGNPAEGGWFFKGYFDRQDSATAESVGKQYYDADLKPIGNWDKQADTTLYALFIGKYDQLIPFVETAPVIDGNGNDAVWAKADWIQINQVWLGGGNASSSNLTPPTAADFTGRFKIVWTAEKLYYLAEITDDVLWQRKTWQSGNMYHDDILELFIDENASGGYYGGASAAQLGSNTRYNAFAHHMSTNGDNGMYVAGSTNGGYVLLTYLTDYIIGNKDNANGSNLYTWEVGVTIVKDNYVHNASNPSASTQTVVTLEEGKKMGIAVAYCDADNVTVNGTAANNGREHFMGSVFVPGTDKNQAYLNAGVFAKMYLVK